jgi:hypothetical protein
MAQRPPFFQFDPKRPSEARRERSAKGVGCVKTICESFERKIDSDRMPLAHEGLARVASSILLLRAGDCFESFYTARVDCGLRRWGMKRRAKA